MQTLREEQLDEIADKTANFARTLMPCILIRYIADKMLRSQYDQQKSQNQNENVDPHWVPPEVAQRAASVAGIHLKIKK